MAVWTERQEKALVDLYAQYRDRDKVPVNDLAALLRMKPADVRSKAKELGVASSARKAPARPVRAKSGRREDLGLYVRSAWEANYARYLNWLVARGEIERWEYEPQTFEFPVKRGNRFYTPDFKVFYKDGRHEWHEVKGWMDKDSQVKIKRFLKYYPTEPWVLIDKAVIGSIQTNLSKMIPNWE